MPIVLLTNKYKFLFIEDFTLGPELLHRSPCGGYPAHNRHTTHTAIEREQAIKPGGKPSESHQEVGIHRVICLRLLKIGVTLYSSF